MSDNGKLVTVFGGSGFVGRHVVRELAKRGYRIRVAVRRPDLAFHLQPLGDVGQIHAMQANLRYRWSVDRACEGADVVINLVGTFDKSGRNNFTAVQADGAQAIAEAARSVKARLVHISAVGADMESDSAYSRTKATGEKAVLKVLRDAVVFRPSVVFGPEDKFFNRFAGMATIAPFLPLIGGGNTQFQPVYVGDVAKAIAEAVDGNAKAGAIYELGGPDKMTFRQCMEKLLEVIHRKKTLITVPFALARFMALFLGLLPNPLLTRDQVTSLRYDNVVSDEAKRKKLTLEGLGITPTTVSAILPTYLSRFRPHGQFDAKRVA